MSKVEGMVVSFSFTWEQNNLKKKSCNFTTMELLLHSLCKLICFEETKHMRHYFFCTNSKVNSSGKSITKRGRNATHCID